jgi:hypothetical protein
MLFRSDGGSAARMVIAIAERMPEVGRRYYELVLRKTANRLPKPMPPPEPAPAAATAEQKAEVVARILAYEKGREELKRRAMAMLTAWPHGPCRHEQT